MKDLIILLIVFILTGCQDRKVFNTAFGEVNTDTLTSDLYYQGMEPCYLSKEEHCDSIVVINYKPDHTEDTIKYNIIGNTKYYVRFFSNISDPHDYMEEYYKLFKDDRDNLHIVGYNIHTGDNKRLMEELFTFTERDDLNYREHSINALNKKNKVKYHRDR